jgi:hypothetical protein
VTDHDIACATVGWWPADISGDGDAVRVTMCGPDHRDQVVLILPERWLADRITDIRNCRGRVLAGDVS